MVKLPSAVKQAIRDAQHNAKQSVNTCNQISHDDTSTPPDKNQVPILTTPFTQARNIPHPHYIPYPRFYHGPRIVLDHVPCRFRLGVGN